jgi:L-ascorbate metabolism protein UlaG (beta-lactamase superfamily)
MFRIGIGIFHVGSVEIRYLTGFGRYTMNCADLLRAAEVLNPEKIIPIHYRGWSHFKEKENTLRSKIAANKHVSGKTVFLTPGVKTDI